MTGSVDHEVVNQRASHQARVLAAMEDAFAHEVHEQEPRAPELLEGLGVGLAAGAERGRRMALR